MAWDRVQRRKRQVEEYKKREAREARDRRRSRRDGLLPEDDEIRSPSSKKKVTFLTQNEQDDNEAEADDAAR
jgi:nucleolar protein 56